MKQVGKLWTREGRKGAYLVGELDLGVLGKYQVAVFKNEQDEEDQEKNRPTHTVCTFED